MSSNKIKALQDAWTVLHEALTAAATELEELRFERRKSCASCVHFDRAKEQCSIFYQRPPVDYIAYGCEYWKWDEIPF